MQLLSQANKLEEKFVTFMKQLEIHIQTEQASLWYYRITFNFRSNSGILIFFIIFSSREKFWHI